MIKNLEQDVVEPQQREGRNKNQTEEGLGYLRVKEHQHDHGGALNQEVNQPREDSRIGASRAHAQADAFGRFNVFESVQHVVEKSISRQGEGLGAILDRRAGSP